MSVLDSFQVEDLEALRVSVQKFINQYINSESKLLVLLEGPMGVGKTQWVNFLLQELGVDEVCSPTFAIHNMYQLSDGSSVDHLDLYRLRDDEDLESTGFWDLFSRPRGLVLIEWGDMLDSDFLPMQWKRLRLKMEKKGHNETRQLILSEF